MPIIECPCGAQFTYPERLAGKRVRCKRCEEPLVLPPLEPHKEEDDGGVWSSFADEAANAATQARERQQRQWREAQEREAMAAESDVQRVNPDGRHAGDLSRRWAAYWKDVGGSFVLILNPSNLPTIITLCIISGVQPIVSMAPCFGFVGGLVLSGWLCSFYFNLVLHAAGGETDMPEMSFFGGWVDDVFVPLFKFAGVTVLCMLPFIVYSLTSSVGFFEALEGEDSTALLLWVLGALAFPMIMLMTALGGLGSLMHPILLLQTLARTFIPYAVTCALVGGAIYGMMKASEALMMQQGGKNPFGVQVLVSIAGMYAWLVAMRVIGLYYHHFKHRFAWSWG